MIPKREAKIEHYLNTLERKEMARLVTRDELQQYAERRMKDISKYEDVQQTTEKTKSRLLKAIYFKWKKLQHERKTVLVTNPIDLTNE